jgi:hypothetical protein
MGGRHNVTKPKLTHYFESSHSIKLYAVSSYIYEKKNEKTTKAAETINSLCFVIYVT